MLQFNTISKVVNKMQLTRKVRVIPLQNEVGERGYSLENSKKLSKLTK